MIASARRRKRLGFTLLEVLLASLIAILLMAALYFAMDVTLRQTQESRDGVDVDSLSRGVYTRMSIDLSASLGPLPPKSGGNSSGAAPSTSSTPTTPTTPTDPTMMATTTPPATTTPAATTPTDPTAAATPTTVDPTTGEAVAVPQAADVGFQAGIVGTDKQLTVFASRLPAAFTHGRGLGGHAGPGDLVRITYWISGNGGLCRQERPWVTADGVRNSTDPDLGDEAGDTLVQEVSDVTFEYFDGSSWLPSWDGSAPSPDGVTPTGPPRAVKVTLMYSVPAARRGDPPYEHSVVQVIPVRAAPGSYTPEMITPSTDMGTTTADPAASGGTTSNMNTTGNGTTSTPGSTTPMTGGATPSSGAGTKTGGTNPSGGGGTKGGTTPSGGGGMKGGTAPAGGGGTKGGGGR